jgi:hypothetical protein
MLKQAKRETSLIENEKKGDPNPKEEEGFCIFFL